MAKIRYRINSVFSCVTFPADCESLRYPAGVLDIATGDILPRQSRGHPGDPLKAGLDGNAKRSLVPPYRGRKIS